MKENKNNLIQIPLSKNRFRHSLALAGFIILLGIGLFGSAGKAQAAGNGCTGTDTNGAPTPTGCVMDGTCTVTIKALTGNSIPGFPSYVIRTTDQTACTAEAARTQATPLPGIGATATGVWVQASLPDSQAAIAAASGQKSPFETEIKAESCIDIMNGTIAGCAKQFFYFVIYTPSAVILTIAAQFFNALINIALSSALFSASSAFLSTAWGTVRDLSNIFFILILLYIAIKIILDMGGHDAKKMIAKVIIIALLINFSMFFTQVIIDSSNILALIFYNKLDVTYKDANGNTAVRPYGGTAGGATGAGEKDIAGSMYSGFDVTSKLDDKFWASAKGTQPFIPAGTAIGVILVAAAIMLFAAYAFLVSGIAFVARVIELFVLIIFSPFAFMSSTVPLFSGVEYIGWDSWIKRLFKVAFMAPIFMFFMYLIFLLLNAKLFGALVTVKNDWVQTILGVIIPGVMILVLLLKATEYAKKGSGVIGEKLMAGAKIAGGLALGAATGGTALLASKSIGGFASNVANDDNLRSQASGKVNDKTREHFAKMGIVGDDKIKEHGDFKKMQATAQKKLATANKYAAKSFDIRDTGLGKFAAKQSGMNFSQGLGAVGMSTDKLKGGQKERDKKSTAKEEEKIESYKMTKKAAAEHDEEAGKHNAVADERNARATQYEADKEKAQKNVGDFSEKDEAVFKEAYVKGGDMTGYGLKKTVTGGSVEKMDKMQTSAGINNDRRKAYAISLNEKNDEAKDADKTFKSEFRKGFMGNMSMGSGIATTVAAAIATGGVSLAAQIASGVARGGVQASRAEVANAIGDDTKSPFLAALRETVRPYAGPSPEIVATIRKEDPNKDFKKILSDFKAGKDGSEEKAAKIITDTAKGPAPATPPTP